MTQQYKPACISARLRHATRKANAVYDAALHKHGINVAQFSLLRAIQRLDRPTLTDLATATQLDASTLGRNVRVLEKGRLVHFKPGKDKRTRVLSLTDDGSRVTHAAGVDWDDVQARLKSRLGNEGYDTLFRLLDVLDTDLEGHTR